MNLRVFRECKVGAPIISGILNQSIISCGRSVSEYLQFKALAREDHQAGCASLEFPTRIMKALLGWFPKFTSAQSDVRGVLVCKLGILQLSVGSHRSQLGFCTFPTSFLEVCFSLGVALV